MTRAQNNICGLNAWAQAPALTCKPGQTCDGWENGEEEEEEEEEEQEEEEEEFDIGSDVICGEIEHFGGLCVDMDDTSEMNTVLTSAGCSREFCYTTKGYLKDKATDKCLTVSDPSMYDDQVKFGSCNNAYTWNTTEKGFKINAGEGFCWHPRGGLESPAEDSNVVIWSGCEEDRLTFQIKDTLCWEEVAGQKLGKKMKNDEGKKLKSKKLDKAKNMCMETKGCKGIHNNGKVYTLCSGKKLKPSKETHSAFTVVPCNQSCDSGTVKCEDGECREQCGEEEEAEGDCPGGTTRCSDGVCRHEHMCQ